MKNRKVMKQSMNRNEMVSELVKLYNWNYYDHQSKIFDLLFYTDELSISKLLRKEKINLIKC